MTKISVLIPVYNTGKYLDNTLNSIVNQTLKDIEVIIVNDGSTDNSENIIKKFTKKYDFIKYFYKNNTGVADTRNILLSKANGEYISFIDSDDTICDTMYEEMYNMASVNNADLVVCDYNEIYSDFTKIIKGLQMESYIVSPPSLWNKIFKRELFEDLSFPNVSIGEDMFITLSVIVKAKKIEYMPKCFYNYYIRVNSLMNKKKYSEYWNDIFYVLQKLNAVLKNYPDELEFLYIQHLLRDSSIRFMYYVEGKDSLNKINTIFKTKYSCFTNNKYYKVQNLRYRIICNLLYHKMYFIVKIIRKIIGASK